MIPKLLELKASLRQEWARKVCTATPPPHFHPSPWRSGGVALLLLL